jgi:ABC-2 type transport system permease protein
MNLIKAELNRFVSRRFILLMVIALFAAFGITVATVLASSQQPTEEMWTYARASHAAQQDYLEREYASCRQALTDIQQCEQFNPDRIVVEDYLYGVFNFRREIKPLLFFLAAFLSLFAFLVTASFIGSELHSGGMTNLLLWRPQRTQVLGAKLGVALSGIAVISTVFTALYVATFYAIASATGWVGGMTSLDWAQTVQLCLRSIGLALVFGGIAFAVATIGRHTAAALGALLGYVVVWEGGARVITQVVTSYRNDSDPWFLSTYVGAWMTGRYEYGFDHIGHSTIYLWHSAAVFLTVVGGLVAFAFVLFRNRDLA